ARLGAAFLNGTDMWQAALDGARLEQADLRQALGLSQAGLNRACGDDTTRLPEDLVVRYCD
ncbi:MAG: pentapeptide repeat-containing protein, partial [Rhodospirillales bacterium]|nr:pentapeptide repeat-containing protein [Rhodospirillales bacterium]